MKEVAADGQVHYYVCKACAEETKSTSEEALDALELIENKLGDWTYYVCPRCFDTVFEYWESDLDVGLP